MNCHGLTGINIYKTKSQYDSGGKRKSELHFIPTHNIIEKYTNGYSWYRIYSDGWIEQGGWCPRGTNVTYLKVFSNNNYTLVACGLSNSTNTGMPYCHLMPNAKTAKGFTGTPSTAVGLFWYACGY